MNLTGKLGSMVLLLSCGFASLWADPAQGTLFYTTFSGGVNVHSVNYDYNGTTFTLSGNTGLASTLGADGILFAPDGNLLVAGQGNNLTEVTTGGTIVKTVVPGTGSFHLALTADTPTALVYNMCNGGCGVNAISAVTLSGGGLLNNGVAYTVSGTTSLDVRGVVLDTANNTWYYGTAPDGGSGDFGTVVFNNTTHTAVLTRLASNIFAHGLTFDPFTNDLIVSSANTIQQLDATGTVRSTAIGTGPFDQSAVDGKGHLFVASNSGNLEFIDYDASGLIGAGGNFTSSPFLAANLDDIAPLAGVGGGGQVPEPSSIFLFGTVLLGVAYRFRKRSA
jgi:hypothetical protein